MSEFKIQIHENIKLLYHRQIQKSEQVTSRDIDNLTENLQTSRDFSEETALDKYEIGKVW